MYKSRYITKKEELINNKSVNAKNREVIKKFLEFEEIRLKRRNNLAEVDERSYKTLNHYISRINNINLWLKNKA
ncbi:MAG: hypothetical protein PHF67_04985, partial [Candidatus Nanoarchaeia archaeon]|nr:hypothetical protein [Candidatus Nanoarchaeia archaeon]